MTLNNALEIFALVTGIIYIILEIKKENMMWVVGIATAVSAIVLFWIQALYASMLLNVYYVVVSVWGLYCWRKDAEKASMPEVDSEVKPAHDVILLRRLTKSVVLWSIFAMVAGTASLIWLLNLLDDPMSDMDAGIAVLSAIATVWLSRSYPAQWFLWLVADTLSAILCIRMGMYWMAGLYAAYCLSVFYGYWHWMRNGKYIE